MKQPKLTMKKWNGDDKFSWAIFSDHRPGSPIMSGLSRTEAQHYKKEIESLGKEGVENGIGNAKESS